MKYLKPISIILTILSLGFASNTLKLTYQNFALNHNLREKNQELLQTKQELTETKTQLAVAKKKLGYLDLYKSSVQVTAYAITPEFGDDPHFANGHSVKAAFAVRRPVLPDNVILNVALSPPAQKRLHARMNDILVIMDKRGHRKHLARFVDTTIYSEERPVVDVFFDNPHQARIWGRHFEYVAINISATNSPFKQY